MCVPVFQRVDQAGFKLPLDERVLADADTLLVFGLDHMVTGAGGRAGGDRGRPAVPARAKGPAWSWARTTTSASSDDPKERDMEYHHHGDALVPRQQRFGQYTRSLMKGLGVPVENRYGLRPARGPGNQARSRPCPLRGTWIPSGWLEGSRPSTSTCTCRTTR